MAEPAGDPAPIAARSPRQWMQNAPFQAAKEPRFLLILRQRQSMMSPVMPMDGLLSKE